MRGPKLLLDVDTSAGGEMEPPATVDAAAPHPQARHGRSRTAAPPRLRTVTAVMSRLAGKVAQTLRPGTRVRHAELALQEANATLDRRVRERTAELEAANAALRESERLLRLIGANTHSVVMAYGMDQKITYVSPSVETLTGFSAIEVLERGFADWVHPDDLQRVRELRRSVFAGATISGEWRIITRQGEEKWVLAAWGPLLDEHGVQIGVQGSLRDITGRKRAEAALAASEARFRALAQNATDVIVLVNAVGAIEYASPSAESVLGYPPGTWVGRPILDLVHPDDLPRARASALANRARPGVAPPLEFRVRHADGSWRTVEAVANNLLDDPNVRGIVQTVRDITTRRESEAAVRQSETTLRLLTEQLPTILWTTDTELRMRSVHGAGLAASRLLPETAIGKTLQELFGPGSAELPPIVAHQRALAGEPSGYEIVIGAGDTLDVRVAPLRDAAGAVAGTLGLGLDITDRKQAQAALQESEERWRALVQNSSDLIVLMDPDGVVHYVSPAVERLLGYQPHEVLGANVGAFVHPDDLTDALRARQHRLQNPGVGYTTMQRLRHADGSWRWFESTGTNLLDTPGVGGIVMNCRDITDRKRDEEALRASERNLRLINDNTDAAIFAWDMQRRRTYISPAVEALTGYSAEEMLAGQDITWVHPDDVGWLSKLWLTLFDGGVSYEREYRVVTRHGELKWVRSNWGPLYDEHGVQVGVQGSVRDISSHHRAERALQESEARYRDLVENSEGIIFTNDLDGNILSANRAMAGALGYEPADVIGYPITEFIAPDARHLVSVYLDELRTTGVSRGLVRVWTSTEEERVWAYASSRADPPGEQSIVRVTAQDITRRFRAEQALKESEDRFRHLSDSAFEAIVVHENGVVTEANRAFGRMYGYEPHEVPGLRLADLVAPESLETVMEHIRSGSEEPYDAVGLRSDGSRVILETVGRTMQYRGRTMRVTALHDITERKQAEAELARQAEELARSNQELQQFAYVASHDLQEPLRMVASYTQLLARRYQGQLDERADQYIHYAVDGANRMKQLIDDLLTYSRVGTGGKDLGPVACREVLDTVLSNLQIAIAEAGATVTHDPLPEVTGDASQLGQLFQNLIGNAIKFRGEQPPRVHIAVCRDQDAWKFGVRDNGIGIDPKHFERIFLMFQRLHVRSEYPGTGIGLALCRRIVERHGGRLWLESRPGAGTVFWFTLLARGEGDS
jgi:PAS domain S-box-containing protein